MLYSPTTIPFIAIFIFICIVILYKSRKIKLENSRLKKELEKQKCENLNKNISQELNIQKETDSRKFKILDFLIKHETITNDEVEYLLKASNSTAYRLLEALEQDKKILQIGKTGRHVYYILNRYKK